MLTCQCLFSYLNLHVCLKPCVGTFCERCTRWNANCSVQVNAKKLDDRFLIGLEQDYEQETKGFYRGKWKVSVEVRGVEYRNQKDSVSHFRGCTLRSLPFRAESNETLTGVFILCPEHFSSESCQLLLSTDDHQDTSCFFILKKFKSHVV